MLRLELGRAAQVRSVAGTLGAAKQASEALVRPRTGLGSPPQGVIASAVSGPRIERIEDSLELRSQLGGRPQQYALQRRDFHRVTVVCPGLHDPTVRPVIRHPLDAEARDRKSTRLNSSHVRISYAVFCLKKKKTYNTTIYAQT